MCQYVRTLPLDQEYTSPVAALVKAAKKKKKIDPVEFCIGDKVLFEARQEPFEYTFEGSGAGDPHHRRPRSGRRRESPVRRRSRSA